MKAIRLESFRCLVDTGFVTLRPLTMLVGRNSSGKSSFLRFLPLLRQSVNAPTTGPIQWYGEYVDFGGFQETISDFSDTKRIRFHFKLKLHAEAIVRRIRHGRYFGSRLVYHSDPGEAIDCDLALTIVPNPKDNSIARFESVAIDAAGQQIEMFLGGSDRIARIVVNGRQPLEDSSQDLAVMPGALLPVIYRRPRSAKDSDSDLRHAASTSGQPLADTQLVKVLRPMFRGNTARSTVQEVARRVAVGTDDQILESLQNLQQLGKVWAASVRGLRTSSGRFAQIRNLLIANALGAILQDLDGQLWRFSAGIRYVKPVRATAQRYYRPQDLAVDQVDPEGTNLAMFLHSLTNEEREEFNDWMETELGWAIATSQAGGHLSLGVDGARLEEPQPGGCRFRFQSVAAGSCTALVNATPQSSSPFVVHPNLTANLRYRATRIAPASRPSSSPCRRPNSCDRIGKTWGDRSYSSRRDTQ